MSLLLVLGSAASSSAAEGEALHYAWDLKGLVGSVLGIFFPSNGEARLQRKTTGGSLQTELLLTSVRHHDGEFYRYGAQRDLASGSTQRVWSESHWRGKDKSRSATIDRPGVHDLSSAIDLLRNTRPREESSLVLWSNGDLYPLRIVPEGAEEVTAVGRTVTADHYRLEGLPRDGGDAWKGTFHVWMGRDGDARPVRMLARRGLVRVRLDLVESPPAGSRPTMEVNAQRAGEGR